MAEIKYLDLAGLKALYGVVDDKITAAKSELKGTVSDDYNTLGKIEGKIKEINGNGANSIEGKIQTAIDELKGEVSPGYDTLEGIEGEITKEVTRATGVEKDINDKIGAGFDATNTVAKAIADEVNARNTAITTAIEKLDVTDTAVDGQFVTAVSETDGKVKITRGTVAAKDVTAEAVAAGDKTVAINGTTADDQIKSLGKTLKEVQDNAAKYEVVKLPQDDVDALADGANIREAYKVVSYTGDFATATDKKQVGEIIKIYKDAALLSVTPDDGIAGENTVIKFKYSLADGTEKDISVDLGKAIFESEMGNGMQVTDNKIAIKLADGSETFLTVGADGLKLAGVQDAIDAALTSERNRATTVEDKIEASVGLNTDGSFAAPTGKNYINGATTVMNAIEKLDAQAKTSADAIAAAVDETAQSITLGDKELKFVAITSKEIEDAANPTTGA